jgi:hypothetical protein
MSNDGGNIPRNIRHRLDIRSSGGRVSLLEERERMRTNWVLTTTVMAMSVTAAVGAQSAKAMHQPSKGDAMSVAYTGCVESVNHGGAFLLTKIDRVDSMHDDKTMKHHGDMAMKHDDMAMKTDAAKTMQHEQAPMADEKMDAMSAKSFALAGSTNLSKHIGQKVSVTGSLSDGSMGTMRQDLSTLTIKTLKVIAKSCS